MASGRSKRAGVYAVLTQLGTQAVIPAAPDEAVLERVPNPHPRQALSRALHGARVHLAVPDHRAAGFRAPRDRLRAGTLAGREQVAEAVSGELPQSRRVPRRLHASRSPTGSSKLLAPRWLRIGGYWYPRGGMPIDVFWQTGRPPAGLWIPEQGVRAVPGSRLTCAGSGCYSRRPSMVARVGSLATISRKPRQARKGATVAVTSGAGGVLVRAASMTGAVRVMTRDLRHELSRPRPQMAAAQLRRTGRAGARPSRARQRARLRPHPPRVPVHRHARRRQDHDRAHPCQVAELRDGRVVEALRRVQRLPRHRRGPLRRPDRGRRGVAHQGRRHARAARQRAVRAGPRPLQGLPDRRSAHAVDALVQRAAEDARRAAAARQVPARDDRSAEAAGHRAVALPAVQPESVCRCS